MYTIKWYIHLYKQIHIYVYIYLYIYTVHINLYIHSSRHLCLLHSQTLLAAILPSWIQEVTERLDCTKLLEEGNQQLQTLYKQKPLDSHGFLRLSCGIPFVPRIFSKANSDCNKYAAASAFRSWWVGSKSKAVVERPVLVQQSNLFSTLILHYKRMSCIRKNHEQSKKVRPWVNSLDFSLQSNVTFDFIHESSYVLKEVPSFSHPILAPTFCSSASFMACSMIFWACSASSAFK